MASKQNKKSEGAEAAHRRSGKKRPADVGDFLRRAPQFSSLANTVEGRELKLSRSQRVFLDNFAGELAECATEGDDAS